ncbi:family 43 glycosylhydrolase [Paenarthrobacter sp. NPDC091669]|uniref:family 43 glycosylhydrolase n=1 Tax=Paenarthrobacter sp. NPDC091669 TaxID=3364384 RepID=UPI00381750E2
MRQHPQERTAGIPGAARNPVLPISHHVPDGEAHVMPDGRLYVYGSYDTMDNWYCSDLYHVVSTSDFCEWRVHEVAFRGQQVPWFPDPAGYGATVPKSTVLASAGGEDADVPSELAGSPLLYAPDAVERHGLYYLYFCMADGSEGVATSDRPEGPFVDPKQLPARGIDPAIFIDDDNKVYFYWGQISARGVQIEDDMMSFDPQEVVEDLVTEAEHGFHEGPSMRKIGALYYLVFSDASRGRPTALGYATSVSPLGPFQYKGIIIDNADCDPESWNNHGSIQCFNDRWYVFYHRSSRGGRFHRRLCLEPLQVLEDGSIPEVPMTSQGVGEPFSAGEFVEAFRACAVSGGARIDVDRNGDEFLTGLFDGDEAAFRFVRSIEGFSSINLELEGDGEIDVFLGETHLCSLQASGGRQSYRGFFPRVVASHEEELRLRARRSTGLSIWGWELGE